MTATISLEQLKLLHRSLVALRDGNCDIDQILCFLNDQWHRALQRSGAHLGLFLTVQAHLVAAARKNRRTWRVVDVGCAAEELENYVAAMEGRP